MGNTQISISVSIERRTLQVKQVSNGHLGDVGSRQWRQNRGAGAGEKGLQRGGPFQQGNWGWGWGEATLDWRTLIMPVHQDIQEANSESAGLSGMATEDEVHETSWSNVTWGWKGMEKQALDISRTQLQK